MESNSFMNVVNCIYQTQVKLVIQTPKSATEAFYNIFILTDSLYEKMKISCMCAENEEESYTSFVDRDSFATMKMSQDLIISFEQFALQLETLLEEVLKNNIQLKLKLGEEKSMIFYTASKMKILTILEIPFRLTSANETIQFFKAKLENLLMENKQLELQICDLDSENKSLRIENQNYNDLDEIRRKEEENKQMAAREQLEHEFLQLRETHDKCLQDKILLLEDIDTYKCINLAQSNSLLGIANDIDVLKNGIEYYIAKVNLCKEILIDQDIALKGSVTMDKYEKLYERFSSAIADLVRCKVHLKKLLALHDLKKVQNSTLKGELNKCIQTIKTLEADHKKNKTADMEAAREGVIIELHDLPDLQTTKMTEMIRELRAQNEDVTNTNERLEQRVAERANKKRR